MANLSTEEEYKHNNYFRHRHGDESVEHCVGNSCDNLIGLAKQGPVPYLEVCYLNPIAFNLGSRIYHLCHFLYCFLQLPEVQPQPAAFTGKPARSEEDNNAVPATAPPHMQEHGQPVYVHSADAEAFAQTEYYSELRRRSLEGRAPIRFAESGEHPIEENLASEDFDVALY
jgi:hypothetical protein